MWTKIKIWEIRRDAIQSLYKDFNGRISKKKFTVNFYYYWLPIIATLILLILGIFVQGETANYFITGISIFAGLFFNLLLVVADKMNVRKQLLENAKDEGTINYVKRYRHFSEQLISQISYIIIISIWLIILMFFIHFEGSVLNFRNEYLVYAACIFKYLINGLIYFFGCQFIIMLFLILSGMYIMLLDDIKLKQ